MKYARLKNGQFNGVVRDFAAAPEPPGSPWEWLPYTLVDPPFNTDTQNRTGPVDVIDPGVSVTRTYTVTPKNTSELDDVADLALGTPQNKTLFQALWEMRENHPALPPITKAAYKKDLNDLYAGYL